jgi:hypothetical protein
MTKSRVRTAAAAFLRDARILRLDATEALRRGRCRHASPIDAAVEAGKADGAAWFLGMEGTSLRHAIAVEKRKIRNLMYAYERTCGRPEAFRKPM